VRSLKKNTVFGVIIAWIVIFAIFASFKPGTFLSFGIVELLMRQSILIGIGALGMTYVIISGGIDLSAGSVIAFSSVSGALAYNRNGSALEAVFACLVAGCLAGLANGALVTKLKAGPFIVTLGSMLALRGLAKGLGKEKTISVADSLVNPNSPLFNLASALPKESKWQLLPFGAWLWVFLLILVSLALRYTTFGRNVVAVGSNEEAARLCGVPVNRVKLMTYALAGLFFGIAGLMSYSRTTLGDPTSGEGDELKMIAAVVIGGASLSGGEGSLVGTAFGVLIMSTISIGCSQLAIPNWIQQILTGVIILTAVALDRYRAHKLAKS
jgi:ribose transport system permease protein